MTGAAQGIGAAIADRLARDGALVGVNGLPGDPQIESVVAATAGFAAECDISDPTAVTEMVAEIERTRGPIDILVCNAAYMSMAPFVDADEDDWWKVVDTNLAGTFHTIQAVLPGMRQIGRGNIVIITSEWGVIGWPQATAYSAAKAGLIALTKTLGRELAPREHHRQRRRAWRDRYSPVAGRRRQRGSEPVRDARQVWPRHPHRPDREAGRDRRGGGAC